jgi:hypothetical protein
MLSVLLLAAVLQGILNCLNDDGTFQIDVKRGIGVEDAFVGILALYQT